MTAKQFPNNAPFSRNHSNLVGVDINDSPNMGIVGVISTRGICRFFDINTDVWLAHAPHKTAD